MSDEEYEYDDDDDFVDDVPFNEAEDLAAHTAQSPVLINYDPTWDTISYPSDWEYYSDEYWEQVPSKRHKSKDDHEITRKTAESATQTKSKRQDVTSTEPPRLGDAQSSLASSGVIWRSKEKQMDRNDGPIFKEGQMEKVSILKDWRERFKPQVTSKPLLLTIKRPQSEGLYYGNESLLDEYDGTALPPPPMSLEQVKDVPSESKRIAQPALEDLAPSYETRSNPLSTDNFDTVNDSILDAHVIESNGYNEAVDQYEILDDIEGAPILKKGPGRPRKRKRNSMSEEPNKCLDQTARSTSAHVKKRKLGRSKTKQSVEASNTGDAETSTETSYEHQRNGNVDQMTDDHAGSAAEDIQKPAKKRGRPKKQDHDRANEQHSNVIADKSTPENKRKRGRPRKQPSKHFSQRIQ